MPSFSGSFCSTNAQVNFTHAFVNCQAEFTGTTNLTGTLQRYWDFGDGNSGTGQVVNHTYGQTGTFNVTLKLRPIGNCVTQDSFLITHPVIIKQDTTKKVDFTHSFNNCQVQFSGTTDFPGNLQWLWDFGDGTTATGQVVNHTYRRLGTYIVTLTGQPLTSCVMYDTILLSKQIVLNDPGTAIDFTRAFTNCK